MAWYDIEPSHGYFPNVHGEDTPHFAVDIPTEWHRQITSLVTGTVVKEDYPAWGSEIFIAPDPKVYGHRGELLYYYHLDELDVPQGAHVKAGQVIGLSGGENTNQLKQYPGSKHPAQPQYSSGPHTHVGWSNVGPNNQPVYTRVPQYEGVGGHIYTDYTLPEGPDISALLYTVQSRGAGGATSADIPPARGGPAAASSTSSGADAAGCPTSVPKGTPWQNVPACQIGNWQCFDPGQCLSYMQTGQLGPGMAAKSSTSAPKDANGCPLPTSATDFTGLVGYVDCLGNVVGQDANRVAMFILGVIVFIIGLRALTSAIGESQESSGQQGGGGGGGYSKPKEPSLLKTAAHGAAGAFGGVAGEKIGKKVFKP